MTDQLQSALVEYLESHSDMSMKDLLSEIKSIIKDVKDDKKKSKKSLVKSGDPKPLNPYQSFVKEQMKIFKDNGTSLTGKELMRQISVLWKQQKDGHVVEHFESPPQSPRDSSNHSSDDSADEKPKDVVKVDKFKDSKDSKDSKDVVKVDKSKDGKGGFVKGDKFKDGKGGFVKGGVKK
jgi:hypothetical protein